jgi:hypothetical protein
MMYPICEFVHLDETFTPDTAVAADHPMIVLRPDLFTTTKPKTRKPKE